MGPPYLHVILIALFFDKQIYGTVGNYSLSVRSLIEHVHHIALAYQQADTSAARNVIADSELFTLPLRSAVEKVPTSRER